MKNNPLNGYQPDNEVNEETAANATQSPETDAANIDPDTGEIIASADAATDYDEELDGDGIDDGGYDSRTMSHTEKVTYFPTCRYCGKQSLPDAPYENQDVANEAATMRCDCFDARQYQDEVERKKRREENIKKLRQRLCDFSDYTATRNMELAGELYDFLLNVGINVLDANIAGATIKVGRFTVKFSVGSKSALSIAFTYSDGAKLEV